MFEQVSRVLVVGDLHGNDRAAAAAIHHAAQQGAQLVVQVGDFGFWPTANRTQRKPYGEGFTAWVERTCREVGVPLLWVRGNHEDHPALFAEREKAGVGPGEPWWMHEHLAHWPDGLVLNVGGKRWLGVGGAHSIDRRLRVEGRSWFPEEKVTPEQAAEIASQGHFDVDVVVAHDAPLGAPFLRKRLRQHLPAWRRGAGEVRAGGSGHQESGGSDPGWPVGELIASDDHQRLMRQVFDARLAPGGVWFHGHHHVAYSDSFDGRIVRGLGEDGDRLGALTALVDADGWPLFH